MKQITQSFQALKYLLWSLLAFQLITNAMPANAKSSDNLRAIIINEAQKTSVPGSLALAVVKMESNFRADHEGADGARGLMQILPDTALSLNIDPTKLWQVRPNLRAGLKILGRLLKRTEGRWEQAIQAYGSARRDPQSVKNQRYVTAVLKSERQFAEQLAATDTRSDRRRDVLAGHDNWDEEPEQHIAQTDANPDMRFDARTETYDDDWQQQDEWEQQAEPVEPPEISIVRGHSNDQVQIIIYETAPPQFQRRDWHPPPPPQYFRPLHPRWFARQQRRFARQFERGPRARHNRRWR